MIPLFSILILLMAFFYSSGAGANPFRHDTLCVPTNVHGQKDPEFTVREGVACGEDETYMQVHVVDDDTVVLYPAEAPLPADEQKDLDRYKKYYGW